MYQKSSYRLTLLKHGKDSVRNVDALTEQHCAIFNDELVFNMSRLLKKIQFMIRDINYPVTLSEVTVSYIILCRCDVDSVRTGEINHRSHRTMGSCFVECHVAVARRVTAASRILICWVSVRIETLVTRLIHYYR